MPVIDMLLGLVPFAGDVADVFWKADLRNIALLERHARPGLPPTRGDYWFVLGSIGVVAAIGIVPIVFLIWLLTQVLAGMSNQQAQQRWRCCCTT